MKFFVDAQLPYHLCTLLKEKGHDAIHTDDLPSKERTRDSVFRVQVNDNLVREFLTGIAFYSKDGALKNNHVYNCDKGITIAYCKGSSIVGNVVNRCTTGVYHNTDSSPLHIVANSIIECTNRYGVATGISIEPEVMAHSGRADNGTNSYSSFVVTGTLSSGVATVTFYNVYSGDRFLVVPNNESGDTQGALYVSLINPSTSQVTVRSTLSTDSRTFTLIKVISGG